MRSFSYVVKPSDHAHGGTLVSAMQVTAFFLGRQVMHEHDAVVSLTGAPHAWPVRRTPRSRGYKSSRGHIKGPGRRLKRLLKAAGR